jgi:hypothetical protein
MPTCQVVLLAAVLALALAAPAAATAPSIRDGSAQRRLDAKRALWAKRAPLSYTYRLQVLCFCGPGSSKPHTFVVRNGRPRHTPKGYRSLNTGTKLFTIVQEAITRRADGLTVRYRRNGLLKRVRVDQNGRTTDEEFSVTVDRFRRLR